MWTAVKLVTKIPGLLRAAKKLEGATRSRTTNAQLAGGTVVVFLLAVVVVTVREFAPDSPFGDVGVAEGVLVLLVTYLGPYVSRLIGGKPGAVTLEAGTMDAIVLALEEKDARAAARVERVEDLTEEKRLLELIRRAKPEAARIVAERKKKALAAGTDGTDG